MKKTINMRSGFTMIELVFVIVIIGILSAVALPKFLETANQAHDASVKSFMGTLNRTVGPTMWAKSIAEGKGGKIQTYCSSIINGYIALPKELTDGGDCTFDAIESGGATYNIDWHSEGSATAAPTWTLQKVVNGA